MRAHHWTIVLATTVAILVAGGRQRSAWVQRARTVSAADAAHIHYIAADECDSTYHEYTDASFTTLKPDRVAWESLDAFWPLLDGEASNTVTIVLKNNAPPVGTLTDRADLDRSRRGYPSPCSPDRASH